MRNRRFLTVAAVVAVAAAVLTLPSAMASAASVKLPPSKYLGDCSGDTPVVVASDAAAQADIYGAVTLAGALGSDCVVLAGDRGADMPADQAARLAAASAGGYVVGGTTAVPDRKLAGRSIECLFESVEPEFETEEPSVPNRNRAGRTMARIAGSDRWATAELVGTTAVRIGRGSGQRPDRCG